MSGRPRSARPGSFRQRARWVWRYLRGNPDNPVRVSASVGAGLFIGCLPLYGLHLPLCLAVCLPLRLDVLVAYVAANISNPLIAPFLLLLEVQVGSLLLDGRLLPLSASAVEQIGVSGLLLQILIGAPIVATVIAGIGALLTWPLGKKTRKVSGSDLEAALSRTIERYRDSPMAHRFYVAMKLLLDPIVPALDALPGSFAEVLDVGCGRGQFSALLLELGKATRARGFDWDALKVRSAAKAVGVRGSFCAADFFASAWGEADTVLLLDVLHYLDRTKQVALLERAYGALRPGGRLVIRDVASRSGVRSRLAEAFERLATRVGYNRAAELDFRSCLELQSELTRLGFELCSVEPCGGALLGNVLIVATRAH